METDERCRFCRFWSEWTDTHSTWGTCERIRPGLPSLIDGACLTAGGSLSTGPDFTCGLWEAIDQTAARTSGGEK